MGYVITGDRTKHSGQDVKLPGYTLFLDCGRDPSPDQRGDRGLPTPRVESLKIKSVSPLARVLSNSQTSSAD